jgi:hypothetical protein
VPDRNDIPTIRQLLREEVTGFILTDEDTPDFIARYVNRHFDDYVNSLKTPFFGALADYNDRSVEAWDCPGHNGGMYFRKSPIGRAFFEYLGEHVFRMDLCNANVELGDLLIHAGPARKAEEEAAKILGADRTYFVLNGTSTSNKVVLSALVKEGDLVLFDRNNHKSNNQGALQIAGGIPVYLETDRNSQGLIGPVDYHAWDEKNIREKIKNHPLVKDPGAWKKPRPFRVLIMQTVTYDGTIYNVRNVLDRVGHLCDYILFDEAWGSSSFHPLFHNNCAMGLAAGGSGIISTQSTHKQLGFSQASQICKDKHIEGSRGTAITSASTSSSCRTRAPSIRCGRRSTSAPREGTQRLPPVERGDRHIEMRRTLRQLAPVRLEGRPAGEVVLDPFVPTVTISGSEHQGRRQYLWEEIPTEVLLKEKQCWEMKKGASWQVRTHRGRLRDGGPASRARHAGLRPPDRAYLDWGFWLGARAVLRELGTSSRRTTSTRSSFS